MQATSRGWYSLSDVDLFSDGTGRLSWLKSKEDGTCRSRAIRNPTFTLIYPFWTFVEMPLPPGECIGYNQDSSFGKYVPRDRTAIGLHK